MIPLSSESTIAPPFTRSPAQAAASRANAQHSTGPRTRLGKLRIRHNGVKHGLYAATAPMIGERRRDWRRLRAMLAAEYPPATPYEDMLLQRAASLLWRLGRVPAAENALFESFGGEAARALAPEEEAVGAMAAEAEEVGVDLLWGLAFRAGSTDSPVNRLARWERSLQRQLREVLVELDKRQGKRQAKEAEERSAAWWASYNREMFGAADDDADPDAAAKEDVEEDEAAAVVETILGPAREDRNEDEAYRILDTRIAFRDNAMTRHELEIEVMRLRQEIDRRDGVEPTLTLLHQMGAPPRRSYEEVQQRAFFGHFLGTCENGAWEPSADEVNLFDYYVEQARKTARKPVPLHPATPPACPPPQAGSDADTDAVVLARNPTPEEAGGGSRPPAPPPTLPPAAAGPVSPPRGTESAP